MFRVHSGPPRAAILLLALTLCARTAAGQESAPSGILIRRYIETLAHDSMRGRGTPSRELRQAARYAAAELAAGGLQPAPGAQGFIQWMTWTRRTLRPEDVSLDLSRDGRTTAPTFGRDFFIMIGPSDSVIGGVTVLGAATDTASWRAHGLRGGVGLVTLKQDEVPRWFGAVHTAMRLARRTGLDALIVVFDVADGDSVFTAAVQGTSIMDHSSDGVPVIGIRRSALERVPGGAAALGRTGPTGLSVRLRTPADLFISDAPNVMAFLPGHDPRRRDEVVVLSAHMDHLGIGAPVAGDSIYNGADDNASGTAAVMAIARSLAQGPPLDRSVLVLLFGAEEQGIRGSAWFVDHSPIPLPRLVADVNLDGVGRQFARDSLAVVGQVYSTLGELVQRVNRASTALGLTVVETLWPDRNYYLGSDNVTFARRGIPSIFFSSSGINPPYHKPADEPSTIDFPWVQRLATLAARTVAAIANAPEAPRWLPSSPYQGPVH